MSPPSLDKNEYICITEKKSTHSIKNKGGGRRDARESEREREREGVREMVWAGREKESEKFGSWTRSVTLVFFKLLNH